MSVALVVHVTGVSRQTSSFFQKW